MPIFQVHCPIGKYVCARVHAHHEREVHTREMALKSGVLCFLLLLVSEWCETVLGCQKVSTCKLTHRRFVTILVHISECKTSCTGCIINASNQKNGLCVCIVITVVSVLSR